MERRDKQGYIRGEIVFTIYENSVDHFSIAKIKIHDTNEQYNEADIVGKGNFINLQKGVVYEFYGQLITHPKFGIQYDVNAYHTFVPETKDAVVAYLSSDLFPGVGKKTAERIVSHLGEQAITTILNDPSQLHAIPNIRKKVKQSLHKRLNDNQGFEKIAVEVTKYGIGLRMAQTLYRLYQEDTLRILKENPYQFVFEVDNFGFLTADKIARINKLLATDKNRIQASCYYALQLSTNDGHVFLPREQCIQSMYSILKNNTLTDALINEQIEQLITDEKIISQADRLYLPSLYYAESRFSERLKSMLDRRVYIDINEAELMKLIGEIEDEESLSYGHEQYEAIKKAIQSPIMILTGGPGTGKTTVVKGIVKTYAKMNDLSIHRHDYKSEDDYPYILTAPTGRAAKRLQESTNIQAMTVHRLLGWDGHMYFEKNEHEQLSGKFLVIDEFSMVDTWLVYHLFKAIPDDMQVLIVGDEDQLPSVGPGQVLADLLSSNLIPTVQLNEIYRQQEGSKIIDLAHDIKHNRLKREHIEKARDFSFIACRGNQVVSVIETIIKRAIKKGIEMKDIQVLAPIYKSPAGIDQINYYLQQLVNPKKRGKRERIINDVTYRIGDRVLQLVNQPEVGVYNGDIGEIVHILSKKESDDDEEQIIIQFDGKEITYHRSDYLNFTLAYCISIHKAQGSEFSNVILPIVSQYGRMLRKNLLYTAITRSKQSLIICGEIDALMKGIETIDTNQRYSTLKTYLLHHEKMNEQSETETEIPLDSLTLKNNKLRKTNQRDHISPYDFL